MNTYQNLIPFSVILMFLIVLGCSDESLGPETINRHAIAGSEEIVETPEVMSRRFTGRDSIASFLFGTTQLSGVPFKARISGEWQDGSCKTLNGTGTATHLGRVKVVEQNLCVEGEEITGGDFMISGKKGYVNGEYHLQEVEGLDGGEARISDGSFSALIKITDTSVQATKVTARDAVNGWLGWGWITGMLQEDGGFTYQIDGWLLHKEDKSPSLKMK